MPTDFLSGLIDRAFERAPVLERRRPSMFEPVAGEARGLTGWTESEEKLEMGPRPATFEERGPQLARAPETRTKPALREAEEAPARVTRPAREPAAEAAPMQRVARGTRETTPPESPMAPPRAATPPAPSLAARVVERQIESRQTIVERQESRMERVIARRAVPDGEAPAAGRTVSPVRQDEPREVPRQPKADGTAPDRGEFRRQPVPRPAPPAAAARAPAFPRVAAAAPAQPVVPTIQVTIGRIELRAAPAAPPARVQGTTSRTPKLALDDYLRQRNGSTR